MKRNWLPPDSFALSRKRRFRPGSLNLRLNKKRKQERKSNLEWKNPVIFVLLALLSGLVASDITATLDSADGSSAFLFKDSGSTTVAQVDSDGNAVFKGGLRLDATGTECATSEMLIVDGKIGVGTDYPVYPLDIDSTLTNAKFGNNKGVYLVNNWPSVGFNLYYDGAWNFGKGSAASYGAVIDLNPGTGTLSFSCTNTGDEYAAATTDRLMALTSDGNLGLGITTPSASLEVLGNGQFRGGLRLDSGGVDCNTAEMLIVDGKIGINDTNPGYGLTVSDVSEWNIASYNNNATSTHRNHLLALRSDSGGAVTTGFNLGGIAMGGYDSTGWTRGWNGGAEISAIATEDWTGANHGTKLLFRVNKNVAGGTFDALEIDQDGSLNSPMWRVTHVMNAVAGPMPKTSSNFTTGGGTLIVFASGSGYRVPSGGIGMNVQVDGVTKGICKAFTNEASSHKAFTTNPIVVTGIAAGTTHTITVTAWNSTSSDGNDYYNVTVLELPF